MNALLFFAVFLNAAPDAPDPRGKKITLPGGDGFVAMDYFAYDMARHRLWVPAGNTASVDVIDATGKVTRIEGFPTAERDIHGQKRIIGPSSVTFGDGVAFIGNRADSTVCAVDALTLRRGACVTLSSPPDGLAYVKSTREVWVTTPRTQSLTILSAASTASLKIVESVVLPGSPEGYAIDEEAHEFMTNLEDKNRTLLIDLRTHKVIKELHPLCNEEGPRGLAVVDSPRVIVVACTDHLAVLEPNGDKVVSTLSTGVGLDNIDYASHLLYAVAGGDARLTVASINPLGKLDVSWSAATTPGTRVVVSDGAGNAYVADSKNGAVWMFSPPSSHH